MAAAPSFEDGHICTACRATLPLHSAKCPYRHSLHDSFDAMAGVAAPLLAGFSIAFIGLVIGSAAAFRWPGLDLAGAHSVGIAAHHSCARRILDASLQARCVRRGQAGLAIHPPCRRWLHITRWSYNSGIALLLLGPRWGPSSCSRSGIHLAPSGGLGRRGRFSWRDCLGLECS